MGIRLAKYGWREIALCTAAAWTLGAVVVWASLTLSSAIWPAIVFPAAFWAWVLWFFRDPQRAVPSDEGIFVSPADGRVADITPIGPASPLGCDGVKVGIFMSVFSVHVNRSPAEAHVDRIEHCPGVYLDARDPHASDRNESATVYLRHTRNGTEYPVVVRQIAGLLARRIVTDVVSGQVLARGQRIGMIKFGSRVELLAPRELVGEVAVHVGQHVLAGRSVLIAAPQAAKGSSSPSAPLEGISQGISR